MDIDKIKRYSLVELALLTIFVIGLFISAQIVKRRMRIVLSEPVGLPNSGLAVQMPASPGWEQTPSWQYEASENCMTLIGQLRSRTGGRAEVRWRYYYATPSGSEEDILESHAQKIGANVHGTDTIGDEIPMVYANMSTGPAAEEQFRLGIMRLEHDRSIELMVKSYRINQFYEMEVFNSLAKSIQYQIPPELTDGRAFLDEFLEDGLGTLGDEAYLLKDPQGRTQGYYYARHSSFTDQENTLRRSQIQHVDEQYFRLKSSIWLNRKNHDYRWETDIGLPMDKEIHAYQIKRDKAGTLSIDCSIEGARTLTAVQFFLPEPLLSEAAFAFAGSRYDAIVIDVISSRGQMVAVRLSKIDPQQSRAKAENVASVVRIDYLHRWDSLEDLLFDKELNILGKYEQSSARRIRIWDTVAPHELQELFKIDLQEMTDETVLNTAARTDETQMTL